MGLSEGADDGIRLADLALNLFFRLGGHEELPDERSFINPLPGYVENKAGDAETL